MSQIRNHRPQRNGRKSKKWLSLRSLLRILVGAKHSISQDDLRKSVAKQVKGKEIVHLVPKLLRQLRDAGICLYDGTKASLCENLPREFKVVYDAAIAVIFPRVECRH